MANKCSGVDHWLLVSFVAAAGRIKFLFDCAKDRYKKSALADESDFHFFSSISSVGNSLLMLSTFDKTSPVARWR